MSAETPGKDRATRVRERLLIDDDAVFEDELAKSSRILRLDSKGGVHAVGDLSKLANRQKIELVLLGRRMARIGGFLGDDITKDQDISKFLGIPVREVQKRAHDLRVMGRIEALGEGSYRLAEGRVPEVLRDLEVM